VQTAPAAQGQDSRPSQIDAAAMRSDSCRHLLLEGLLDDGGGLRRLCLGCQSRKRAPGEISPQATPATEKTIWGEKAQGKTGIGDGGVGAAEVEAGRTRQAPALSGPSVRLPLASRAIEPPPRPKLHTSGNGWPNRWPQISPFASRRGVVPVTKAMSVVVPPMSMAMEVSRRLPQMLPAPWTTAAGPEA